MDDVNIAPGADTNKKNRALMIIFLFVLVITVALGLYYLYTRYSNAKNNKVNDIQNTNNPNIENQNGSSLLNTNPPVIYNEDLPPAKAGEVYKTTVQAGIYDLNVQLIGIVGSGLPEGLNMAPCTTEYDSPIITKFAVKNSYSLCTIEGIPQKSGSFLVKVYFSVQGGEGKFFKALPLVVNP